METFQTLISVLLGGLISFLAQWLAHRQENQREVRAARERKVKAVGSLYQNMLGLLQLMSKRLCRLETKKLGWYYRLLARFRLESTPDILAQLEITGGALNAWAVEAAEAEPRPVGDSALVFATWQCDHQKHADALFSGVPSRVQET
ncbi:MAG: hypothetical protein U0638_13690 [Phycisphaerales bacterium]